MRQAAIIKYLIDIIMGDYLSTPKKDKDSIDGQNAQVSVTLKLTPLLLVAEVW